MPHIKANTVLADRTYRNQKSPEINLIDAPSYVNSSTWIRGLVKNGFEIWEGTSNDDLIIGNQERTNFVYGEWGDDDITGGNCIDHIIAGPGVNTVRGGADADRFVLGKFEQTVILDFEEGIDKLVISTGISSYHSKKTANTGDLDFIKIKKGLTDADTVVEAHIEGSVSYFYLTGMPFDSSTNGNNLWDDIFLLGGQTQGTTENLIPLG